MVEFASFLLFDDNTEKWQRVIMHIQSVENDVMVYKMPKRLWMLKKGQQAWCAICTKNGKWEEKR